MSSVLPEATINGTILLTDKLVENISIFPSYMVQISLIVVLTYLCASNYVSGKNGFLNRFREFLNVVKLVNKYPGPSFYPFLGSTPEMTHLVFKPCRDLFPWMQRMARKYGPIYRLWNFHQPKLVITCSETAILSLKEEFFPARTSELVEVSRAAGAEGLVFLAPDVHGPRKKMWKQWFTRKIISGNLEIFQKEAIRLSKILSTKTDKPFDFVDYGLHCTFRTIASSAFGEEVVNCVSEADALQHFHSITTIFINLFTRNFRPWLAYDFIYYLTPNGKQTRKCVKNTQKFLHNAIKHAQIQRKTKSKQMDTNTNLPCFIDHLLDNLEQGDLTENEVFQEVNDFIIAGYDTTGLTLCWTLYLLGLHPEYQTKIVDELYQIFNGNIHNFSSQVTTKHLQDMRYLELCIKESLRFYPAIGMHFRRSATNKKVVMPDGNVIPSGVDMYIPVRIIHQDPKYFPDPQKFIPERHLVSIPAYMPFGQGSRSCIAQVYALQELKMILAYLLMEYKWETLEEPDLEPLMVPMSYPENGIRFKILGRNYN